MTDVLVCPTRVVSRLTDLTANEAAALFTSVQRVGKVVERAYGAHGLTIACQVNIILVYLYNSFLSNITVIIYFLYRTEKPQDSLSHMYMSTSFRASSPLQSPV